MTRIIGLILGNGKNHLNIQKHFLKTRSYIKLASSLVLQGVKENKIILLTEEMKL